jgi:hypothetical protein
VAIGPNSQVLYLPTPLKRPEPRPVAVAIESGGSDWDGDDGGLYESEGPF